MSGTTRRALQVAASPVLWTIALFGCAGTFHWARGWICLALYVAAMTAAGLIIRRVNAPVIEARSKWRRSDTKPFDKVFLAIFLPLTLLQPAVAGLDAVRFRWSSLPFWLVYPGGLLFLLAMALITWTLAVNRYAETTVRIQTDRGHTVISTGPYRIVRHPMYVGAIVMYDASAVVLGSLWALALSGLIATLLIWRTALEDQTLRRELPGYEEFSARTRYRLLPGVW